jgi:hypothetical protein
VLRARGIRVPQAAHERILAQKEPLPLSRSLSTAHPALARICHTEERAGRLGHNCRRLVAALGKRKLGSVLQAS